MIHRILTSLAVLTLLAPGALAQETPAPKTNKDQPPAQTQPVSPDQLAPVDDNPNKPTAITPDSVAAQTAAKAPTRFYAKDAYPSELLYRPLTLPKGMLEVGLEVPVTAKEPQFSQILRAAYGVTRQVQVGVTYDISMEDPSASTTNPSPLDGGAASQVGKTFSLDAAYYVVPRFLAISASLPFHVSPFAASLSVGAPFRIALGKFAIFGGDDLFTVKLSQFAVDPNYPFYNEAEVTGIAQSVDGSRGNININVGGLYQAKPNLAAFLTFGRRIVDFQGSSSATPLYVGAVYTAQKNHLDLSARLGMADMGQAADTFQIVMAAAYRL